MLVTMLEAEVEEERHPVLVAHFSDDSQPLPPPIVESYLVRGVDNNTWRIITVWRSREEVEDYRASVETPGGVLMFRAAGAEPSLTVWEVAAHLEADGSG